MALTLTCKNCRQPIAGQDEDELVTRVQAHVRAHADGHGRGRNHEITREQILTRARREHAAPPAPPTAL
jgi:predicted small metal-binding protein